MGLGDFWLQLNNGKKYSLKNLKDIKSDDVAKNPKFKKLIEIFNWDNDGDGKISVRNTQGKNEWESVFADLQQAAVDNDLTSEEFGLYISQKSQNADLKLDDVNELLDAATKSTEEVTHANEQSIIDLLTELGVVQQTITDAEFDKIKSDAYNTVLTIATKAEKLDKDYEDLHSFAKEKLSKSGKQPMLQEIVLYAAELQLLNPDIKADKKIKKGTSINLPVKSLDKKKLQLLETKGIKVEKDNYIFFQKLLELDDTKQAVVFNVINNSKFKTKEEVINEVYNKTKINLADTGLTIKVGSVSSTLENFITKTLKLDLSSKEGLKIYDRLSRLNQTALDSLPKEFIAKLSKMNNITFDKLADKAEVFGIILRADEEMKEREKNSQAYRDLKVRMFMAQYVADNYTSAVTISQSADRNLNFTQGAWWIRNARPIGYTSNEQQKRDTAKVNQIKKLIQDVDTLSNEEFTKKMGAIMEAERTVRDIDFSLPGEPSLPSYSKTKDPSFKFDPKLAYTFMKQMQRAELAATVAKRLEPERKQKGQNNPYVAVQESTRVHNTQVELASIEYTVEPLDKKELEVLKQYIESIKTRKELFLFAKSLHYKVDVISNRVETMIPKENQAEIAKLLEQKAKKLGYAEPTRPNSISLDTFRNVFTKPIDKKVNYPKTNEKTLMETYEATKTKLLGSWDPVGEQIRIQEMEGTVGGVLDIATMILVTKGMGSMGAFVRIGNVGRNIGTATNVFRLSNTVSRFSKNATLINRLAKADKVLGGLWVNGTAGALHGSATMGGYGLLQGGVGMADNTIKNLLEGKEWSDGLGERFEQTLVMGWENAKFGLFAGYSGVLAQALGKGTVALGAKGIDKLFKTNYSKTVLDKVSNVVTEEGISGSEFFTKMQAASKAEGLVGFGYETGFFTLYHKMEEAGVDFNNEESLLTYIQNNLDEETKQSLGATYVSEGGNLAMFKAVGALIQWVHIGKLSSSAAMEIQAKNNRALRDMNMRKVVENGKESYLVKFNENDKPIKVAPEQLMQLCEQKMFYADIEDKVQKDGKFKLPSNQTVEYDKAKKVYRTVIDAHNTVESSFVEELLNQVNKITFKNRIDEQLAKENKIELNDGILLTKTDGKYQIEITLEDGKKVPVQSEDLNDVIMRAQFVKLVCDAESTRKNNSEESTLKVEEKKGKILEGGISDSELTEVAPFARHIVPHSVTDPFIILAEDLDERANSTNFDLTKYEKTGFPLKYSRQEFTQRLKDLVNNMPIEAQREILKKFNIELNYTGDSFELRDVPKIPRDIKNPLEFAIKTEIERFTKENEIEIDNPEVKVFLDDFIKLAPEFLFIVGKKQHETHAYMVDVHTIKVLQNAIEHPEYKNLSAEDKMVLNTAILLHDIAKQFVDTKTPDDSHAEYGYNYAIKILDRFNLSNDIKQRIVKLIRNHEFFKSYNQAYIPFKSEAEQNELGRQNAEKNGYPFSPRNDYAPFFNREVEGNAGRILNTSDFRLAKILTYSDLKSVNPDKTFIREEWNIEKGENEPVEYQGFEKFVTGTHSDAEFKEYLDESLSYIEKELQKYDGGKIEDEFVYETELAETGLKLFGRTDFFESITRKSGQNQPYAVHRSDFNMIIQARQALLDAGVKEKEVRNLLSDLIKHENGEFSPELTSEFIKAYLENKEFIDSHNISLGGSNRSDLRNAEILKKEIAHIKEKESIAEIFKKYNVKDEWMQKRLVDSLYTSVYNREIDKYEPVFVKEAQDAMLELFDMKKFTTEEIYKIIYNSFSKKDHRGIFRENDNSSSLFNRQIFDTILEFSKEESLDNAIQDTHLCFVNPTPESGWVIAPEILASVKELNKMGIKDKRFIRSTFDIKYKDGKNQYNQERIIESITKNELYEKAIKYSKQGFDSTGVDIIINSSEIENGKVIYPEHVQDKIANLVKLGVYNNRNEWIKRTLFDDQCYDYSNYNIKTRKFNETNYNFIVNMLNKGISPEILDNMFYHSLCQTYEAEKAAPDKMVETGKFSKAQVEAMVDFFKEIGFDKAPRFSTDDMYHDLAECFMDIVELTSEELEGMCVYSSYFDRMMPMPKMSEGMAPFRVVNKEKFNQALDYYKKGVSITNLKHLTETPELYKELKNEADLSFIKTENDADLVSTFWKMKDVKSINELSKQERIQFMNELMMHKSEIEGNNVSDKISILPKDSQGYSDMMKNIADSFGLNSEPYTQQKVSQINKSFSDISARLQTIKPSEIETDNSINQIINEITSIVPNLNRQNISSILLTLQRVVKSPEYQTLSENDKKLMNIAVVFSKVDSTSKNPFDSAIDACVFAKQIGLSDTDAMKIFAIVKNSNLTETVMSTKRNVKTNKSRSYIHIVTDDIKETFETAAMELKDYNNFQMAKLLYTANEDFVSPQMLQEYAPDLYQEFLNIRNSVQLENGEVSKDAKAMQIMQNNPKYTDKLEEVKLKGRDKYSLSRNLNKLLEEQIDEIKSCDVLLPQTNLSDFIKKQSPEWIKEHTRNVNGRNVLVIGSDEIPDFYMLSHTTQAFNISGKADATTNMSNFENFAMLFNDKTICLSYSGNGKIAVVGNVGLLIQTPNTSQYIARGTDISSVAKDIPTMISEYISHRSQIIQKGRFQTKATKDYDRNFFASLIKEELSPGYRKLLDQKISLEEQIREYNSEKTNESLESLQQKLKDVKNQMRPIDKIYRMRIENLINKANGEVIDLEFIRNNDPELGTIYDKILNTINVEHRGNDGIMRTEYHNEVLGSNTKPVGLFVRGDKELFNLTDDYLKKAEEDTLPIVIYK